MLGQRGRRGPTLNQHWFNVLCLLGTLHARWCFSYPALTRSPPNVRLMLGQRSRRGPTLNQRCSVADPPPPLPVGPIQNHVFQTLYLTINKIQCLPNTYMNVRPVVMQ